jgi:hypothetical protein
MRVRTRLVALALGAVTVAGAGAGAVAATQGGSAGGLAAALNERAGTNLTGDQVQSAMKDLMADRLAADVAAGRLTQAQADEILANAPDGPPMFGGPGGHHGGPGARADILGPVADLLKLEESALRERVEDGDTLADVAADQGLSKESLVAGIAAALKASKPAGAPELTDAQITAMATRIAEDSGPCVGGGRPGGGPGGGGAVAPPADDSGGAGATPITPVPATPSV